MNIKAPINEQQVFEKYLPNGFSMFAFYQNKYMDSITRVLNYTKFPMKEHITSVLPDNDWVDCFGEKIHFDDIPEITIPKEDDTTAFWVGFAFVTAVIMFVLYLIIFT